MKAYTVGRRGEKGLFCDPESDLRLEGGRRKKKKCKYNRRDEQIHRIPVDYILSVPSIIEI